MTKTKICIPETMIEKVSAFFNSEKINIEPIAVCGDDCLISVLEGSKDSESDLDTLYAGGWISCTKAWGLAEKIGISVEKSGRLLDCLKIKIRRCALGCFK